MKYKYIILILILLNFSVFAKELSKKQIETLKTVKEVALKYPNKHGETFEKTAMAICLSETSAGVMKIGDIGKNPNIFKASLGIMQVRLQTARFIAKTLDLKDVKNMSDIKLVNRLLSDDRFNIRIAVQFLVWLNDQTSSYFRTVSRYNGGNHNKKYYYKVMKNMQLVKKLNI
jgi:hypothetical protein